MADNVHTISGSCPQCQQAQVAIKRFREEMEEVGGAYLVVWCGDETGHVGRMIRHRTRNETIHLTAEVEKAVFDIHIFAWRGDAEDDGRMRL